MIILLTLLSLCATECRVHRNVENHETRMLAGCQSWNWKPDSCVVDSHWFPCRVVEKCDTVCLSNGVAGSTYRITCHPETTLVDSGVNVLRFDSSTVCTVKVHPAYGRFLESIYNPPDSVSIPQCLDSAELADIREMLREWRVEKCFDSAYNVDMRAGRWPYYKAIQDSCECVYGGWK